MEKIKLYVKRILLAAPLGLIAGISLLPLQTWMHQALVLFALLWFYGMLFTEVLGK